MLVAQRDHPTGDSVLSDTKIVMATAAAQGGCLMLCCQCWARHAGVSSPGMNATGMGPPKHAYTRQPDAGYACALHVWQPYPREAPT